jgi:hypothetical protein
MRKARTRRDLGNGQVRFRRSAAARSARRRSKYWWTGRPSPARPRSRPLRGRRPSAAAARAISGPCASAIPPGPAVPSTVALRPLRSSVGKGRHAACNVLRSFVKDFSLYLLVSGSKQGQRPKLPGSMGPPSRRPSSRGLGLGSGSFTYARQRETAAIRSASSGKAQGNECASSFGTTDSCL